MKKTPTSGIEYVSCPLCGADNTELMYHMPVRQDQEGVYGQDVWDIVQCKQCKLIYTNPRPDASALAAYYTFANDWDYQFVQDWFIENADLQRSTWQRYLRIMHHYAPPGKLLDVGCGAGTFLLEAQKAGNQVIGQEVSPYFAAYGRTQHHLDIREGEIEDISLGDHTFDFVTAFDVIEHHPYPQKLLREMHRLLKPGGVTFITTHDIGNFYARRYGAKWRYLNPIGHLTYFTRETLQEMLHNAGFRTLKVGGCHTIGETGMDESVNKVVQFGRVILLRSLVISLYKPVTQRFPRLARWQVRRKDGSVLDHKKLLVRAGNQIVMDDDMVLMAVAE